MTEIASSVSASDQGIRSVFERVYEGSLFRCGILDRPEGSRVIATIFEISELPANLGNLLKVLSDENSDARTVARVAMLNPAVAGKILKVVNSSATGLQGKVTSLKRAVALLGYEQVRSIVLGASIFTSRRAKFLPPTLPISELWNHSAAVGSIATLIAHRLGDLDAATLLSAGLLHDTGKLILAMAFKEKFTRALKLASAMMGELSNIELRGIGVTHQLASAALCKSWNLPERLWGLIAAQEHPALGPDGRAAAALQLAEFYARTYSLGLDGQWAHGFVPEEVCWHLGLTPESAPKLIPPEDIRKVVERIGILKNWE